MNPIKPDFEVSPALPEAGKEIAENGAAVEVPKAPESVIEQPIPAAPASALAAPVLAPTKDATTRSVEAVLEEGIRDTFATLPPETRAKFKREGEQLTRELTGMIQNLKAKAGRVLALITSWLKLIPGVNHFFLMQEAKIKTDRILALAEAEKKRRASST